MLLLQVYEILILLKVTKNLSYEIHCSYLGLLVFGIIDGMKSSSTPKLSIIPSPGEHASHLTPGLPNFHPSTQPSIHPNG